MKKDLFFCGSNKRHQIDFSFLWGSDNEAKWLMIENIQIGGKKNPLLHPPH